MAEEGNNGAMPGAAPQAAAQPRLQILNQYVRDLSFENIAAQKGIPSEGQPDVKVQVNIDAQQRPGDRFEVALKLKVDSRLAESPVFLLELDNAGMFLIQNLSLIHI